MQRRAQIFPALIVLSGITAHFLRRGKQIDVWRSARSAKMASDHEPITAVIAFAAKDYDRALRNGREARRNKARHPRASIFHKGRRWNSLALGGEPVDLTHLFGCQNLHGQELTANVSRPPASSTALSQMFGFTGSAWMRRLDRAATDCGPRGKHIQAE